MLGCLFDDEPSCSLQRLYKGCVRLQTCSSPRHSAEFDIVTCSIGVEVLVQRSRKKPRMPANTRTFNVRSCQDLRTRQLRAEAAQTKISGQKSNDFRPEPCPPPEATLHVRTHGVLDEQDSVLSLPFRWRTEPSLDKTSYIASVWNRQSHQQRKKQSVRRETSATVEGKGGWGPAGFSNVKEAKPTLALNGDSELLDSNFGSSVFSCRVGQWWEMF